MEILAFLEYWGGWIFGVLFVILVTKNYKEFKKLSEAKTTHFRFFLFPSVIILLLSPLFYASMPLFMIYRQIVRVILRLRYGSKFGGLLDGSDVIFSLENKTPLNVFLIIQYKSSDSDFYEHVRKTTKKSLLAKCKEDPKIFGILQKSLGYPFMLKDEVTFEECFKKLKVVKSPTYEMTKSELTHLVSEYSDVPLPKNRQGLWDVLVGTQPVRWRKNDQDESVKYYPVIFRGHHSMADGWHLFRGITELVADDNIKEVATEQTSTSLQNAELHAGIEEFIARTTQFLKFTLIKFTYYAKQRFAAFMCPGILYINSILMHSKENILFGPITNQKILCLNVEEQPHYIQVVKRIKRKFPGTAFEDIFLAAYSASFNEYFRKYSLKIPKYLVAEVPSVPHSVILSTLDSLKTKNNKLQCKNSLTACVRKLPVGIAFGENMADLVETLKFITREGTIVKSSFEPEMTQWSLSTAMGWFIEPLNRLLVYQFHDYCMTLSNMPGPTEISVVGGCPVQDIIAFPTHRNNSGLGAAIMSYNQRLRLSLIVDKAIISETAHVQEIVDRIFHYIDLLDKAT